MTSRSIYEALAQYSLTLPTVKPNPSSNDTTTPTYPRTDLNHFNRWANFEIDVAAQRQMLKNTITTAEPSRDEVERVGEEADVVARADTYIFSFLRKLMRDLGTEGYMETHVGNKEVICDPDRVWVPNGSQKATFVAEFKSWWAFPETGDLSTLLKKSKVRRAVGQLFAYMSFNHLRYGALSTFQTTWFFRRVGPPSSGVLEVSQPISFRNAGFLLEAYLFVLRADNWFYASPVNSPNIPRRYGPPTETPRITNKYKRSTVTIDQVHFARCLAKHRAGSVVVGQLGADDVVMKCVDATKNNNLVAELEHEASVYQIMESFQGKTVPRFIAYGDIWQMLHFIAIEPGHCNVADYLFQQPNDRAKILNLAKDCLRSLHYHNIVHGDIKLENFLVQGATIQIIDFGSSLLNATRDQLEDEMSELEEIFSLENVDMLLNPQVIE